MGPFDTQSGPDILGGLQRFSQGNSAASGMVNLGLSLFGQNAGQAHDAAVRDGMDAFAQQMQKSNGDPSVAMTNFVQTPEGHKLMAVQGAFQTFTDLVKTMIQSPPVMTQAPQGSVLTRYGKPYSPQGAGYTPPAPQPITTGSGQTTEVQQPGAGGNPKTTSTRSVLPSETQNTKYIFDHFADNLTPDGVKTLAMATLATTPLAQAQLQLEGLQRTGQIDEKAKQMMLSGQYSATPDAHVPGRFYITDKTKPPATPGAIQVMQVGGMGPNNTLSPSWATGAGRDPSTVFSGPGSQGSNFSPQPGTGIPPKQGAAVPPAQIQATAQKYGAPVEAVRQDGTIDPVQAYGPGVLPILGAGLPAIAQNRGGIIERWFHPSSTEQSTALTSQAEIANDSLQYLLLHTVPGNSRIKAMVEGALELGPEHEKWTDPQYATEQLIQMRSTFSAIARNNAEQIGSLKMEGVNPDNAEILRMTNENSNIKNILDFLPSEVALRNMLQGIRNGKIQVPSVAGAASTLGRATSEAVGAGARAVGLGGTIDKYNADVPGTVQKIENANMKQLRQMGLAKQYPNLDPAIKRAFDARIQALRGAGNVPASTPKASNFVPDNGTPQGPSVKQFTQNPAATASNPFERAKQQRKQTPFSSATSNISSGRVDNAFSQFGM